MKKFILVTEIGDAEIFGRIDENGDISILHSEDGVAVTRLLAQTTIYPINSTFSCAYDHPGGIKISLKDSKKIGLPIK